jgi:hypothetical protein
VTWVDNGQCNATPSYTGYCVTTIAGDGKCDHGNKKTDCFRDGPGTHPDPTKQAQFNIPMGIAVAGQDKLYVVDFENSRIRKLEYIKQGTCRYKVANSWQEELNYTGYCVTTIAGDGGWAIKDGPGEKASFINPRQIALDSKGNLFILEYSSGSIRKIEYLTSGSCAGQPIQNDYCVTTFAGKQGPGYRDGPIQHADPAKEVLFTTPVAIAIDTTDRIFVADAVGIRKIEQVSNATCGTVSGYTGYCVSTVAGTGGDPKITDYTDGPALARRVNPITGGLATDSKGNLYLAEHNPWRIRKFGQVTNVKCGSVSGYTGDCLITIAGGYSDQNYNQRLYRDGEPAKAWLTPMSLVWNRIDSLLFIDGANNRIRRLKLP